MDVLVIVEKEVTEKIDLVASEKILKIMLEDAQEAQTDEEETDLIINTEEYQEMKKAREETERDKITSQGILIASL